MMVRVLLGNVEETWLWRTVAGRPALAGAGVQQLSQDRRTARCHALSRFCPYKLGRSRVMPLPRSGQELADRRRQHKDLLDNRR